MMAMTHLDKKHETSPPKPRRFLVPVKSNIYTKRITKGIIRYPKDKAKVLMKQMHGTKNDVSVLPYKSGLIWDRIRYGKHIKGKQKGPDKIYARIIALYTQEHKMKRAAKLETKTTTDHREEFHLTATRAKIKRCDDL